MDGIFRRRKLPHWDVEDKPIFITGCLEGSIPAAGMNRLRQYRTQLDDRKCPENLSRHEWELHKDKLEFKFLDDLLDEKCPVDHFRDARLAQLVCDAFLHFAGKRYSLLAFVVMPSHHHWVFLPKPDWLEQNHRQFKKRTPREVISHSIQSYTAKSCNELLGRKGRFWQPETYDHWVRDQDELGRVIDYVEQNPVKARLVDQPEQYRWSSAWFRRQSQIKKGEEIR